MNEYKTEKSVFTAEDFLLWQENKMLEITPKFQRRSVWRTPARSYFIDTLLRGMTVPELGMRNKLFKLYFGGGITPEMIYCLERLERLVRLRPGACGSPFLGDNSLETRTISSNSDLGTASTLRMTLLKR